LDKPRTITAGTLVPASQRER